jgi:transposase
MTKKYDSDFKAQAVALALSSDLPYSHIAQDLGVNRKTFNNWISCAMKKNPPQSLKSQLKPDYHALERENKAMKKELDLRKKEIEILKKAAVYFASQS